MNGKMKKGMISGSIVIGVAAIVIPFVRLSGQIETKVDTNIKDIVTLEEDVEEVEEEVVERRLVDLEQSMYLEQMQRNQIKFIKKFEELQAAK